MNSGQPRILQKIDSELEFPNIVLTEEVDWLNKLNVNLSPEISGIYPNWSNIVYQISLKYKFANIIVEENALAKLLENNTPLLPTYLDILNNPNLKQQAKLTIQMLGNKSAKLEFLYSNLTFVGDIIFTMLLSDYTYYSNSYWIANKDVLLDKDLDRSDYQNYYVYYVPSVNDVLEFEFVIYNLPLLNPITQNTTIRVKARGIVEDAGQGDFGIKMNFTTSLFGNDIASSTNYKIFYNLSNDFAIINIVNGEISYIKPNDFTKLWIQIYSKTSSDINYLMSFREEEVGTENCYIEFVRLIMSQK